MSSPQALARVDQSPTPSPQALAPVLVVGSLGLDTLKTPAGEAVETLGGTAAYFCLAASLYTDVWLVAVVGTDFPARFRRLLEERPIDLRGLQVVKGRTFRWTGEYGPDLNVARTLDIQLNVFAEFHPRLPEEYRHAEYVFLANIQPSLQLEVLEQVRAPKLVAVDSRDLWIERSRSELTEVIARANVVLLNDAEARQYAGTSNLVAAADVLLALGPEAAVIKKGEHGAMLFSRADGVFWAPAYPLRDARDPTGAGDSFAGAFMGYLASVGERRGAVLRRAVVHGSTVASFTVEDFGVERLRRLTVDEIRERHAAFRSLTLFEEAPTELSGAT